MVHQKVHRMIRRLVHGKMTFSKIRLTAVSLLILMASSNLAALGLGALVVQSNLDQPLNGVIELRAADGDDLSSLNAVIATREDFASLGIDYPEYMEHIRIKLENDGGNNILRVDSQDVVIKEPFIHLLVRVDWSAGSFLREYTALIDPPIYAGQAPQSASQPRVVGTDQSFQEVAVQSSDLADEQVVTPEVFDAPATAAAGEPEAVVFTETAASDEPQEIVQPGVADETAVFNSDPASVSTDAQYGPVGSGESLSLIAADLQRQFPDLSIYQIMKVLFEENRAAFIDGNINGLMKGEVLNLGDLSTIRAVDVAAGKEFFYQHLNDWNPDALTADPFAADSNLRVAQDEYKFDDELSAAGSSSSSGNGTFQVGAGTDSLAAVSGADGVNRDGEVSALQRQITELETTLSSSELENREMAERISLLEGQLGDMNRLLSLDVADADLAGLEARLAGADDTVAIVDEVATADDTVALDSTVDEQVELTDDLLSAPDDADLEVDQALAGDDDLLAVEDGLDEQSAVVAETAAAATAANAGTVFKESSLFEKIKTSVVDDGLWRMIAGLGALLLAGIGLVFFRRRRADQEFEISMLSIETHSQSVNADSSNADDGDSKAQDRETSFLTVYSDSDAVVQADEVDPVAEADVYIAYGRDEQAEEVLMDGITRQPNRIDIKQKLLRLYHKNNQVEGFERIAEELYSQKDFLTAEIWQEVSLMGKGIAPKNPLFDVSASEMLVGDRVLGAGEDGEAEDSAEPAAESAAKVTEAAEVVEPVADVPVENVAAIAAGDTPVEVVADKSATKVGYSIDDILDDRDDSFSDEVSIDDGSQAVDFALAEDDASINLINFDDGRSEISELDEVQIDALVADDDKDSTNASEVEFDDEVRDAEDKQQQASAAVVDPDLNKGDNSDDRLDFEQIQVPDHQDTEDYMLRAAEEVSDLEIDDDYNETRTQYELAKVFVDLGDEDGARKILNDIISANQPDDDDVVADASKLLESISR